MKERPLAWFAQTLEIPGTYNKIVKGAEIDSRKVQPGQLFFALRGKKFDGHAFLRDVADRGAVAAVVAKDYNGENFGLQLFKVECPTIALQTLAKREREERKIRVIAVTGSVGKTTTKEFLADLLQVKFRTAKTPGNSNSQVSIPLSILNSHGDEELFVMEMGMSEPNEIEKLVEIAPPYLGLITRVGLAHVGAFTDGIEGVARAKAQIFAHPQTRYGVYNAACADFSAVTQTGTCEKLSFAYEKLCERPADYLLSWSGSAFVAEEKTMRSPSFTLPFHATHLCEDFMAAAAAARILGVSWDEIISQAAKLTVYKARFEQIEKDGILFINDAYNANPTSMRAAFANLPKPEKGGRRIGVIGTMVELGSNSELYHREIGQEALAHFDHLLCIGKECLPMIEIFAKQGRSAEHFADLASLQERLTSLAQPKDVVLIKGSNSVKLWQILER